MSWQGVLVLALLSLSGVVLVSSVNLERVSHRAEPHNIDSSIELFEAFPVRPLDEPGVYSPLFLETSATVHKCRDNTGCIFANGQCCPGT